MRFSYATTLAFEKYGAVLVLCVGILFGAIADSFNPFFPDSQLLYYGINLASVVVGLGVGSAVYPYTVSWMREHTIWHSEWEREHGTRLPPAEKVAAFIPVLKALWNIFRVSVVVVTILGVAGVICFGIFKGFA
ncbi:hypothetical protein WP3W18E02_19550 [Klebsiella sp. WP3-W18-ESBL-02]|nr:hypothetical protein WP3W18E02_19550 [Klebsiella sp. WP3-W18-ESBL-02]